MPDLWHTFLHWFCARLYYARISIVYPERLPRTGPVLFVGLHRNGAVDGFVYRQALRQVEFMVSTQLLRNAFSRLFFNGIAVARSKDEDSSDNSAALQKCVEFLRAGGRLFVFPEGTSSLGPRHLPFKAGAAWLIQEYLKQPGSLAVVPVGIHYERAWAFRSKVEVVIGESIFTEHLPDGDLARLKELRRRIQKGLEAVGVNVPTAAYQGQIEQLAYISTLATPRSYFESLKAFESSIPAPVLDAAECLDPQLRNSRLLRHQGVPLFPMHNIALYAVLFLVLGPVVLSGIVLNLPAVVAGWWAGRKFPDDRNVIALWRILVGVPVFLLWSLCCILGLLITGKPLLALGYVMLTWLSIHLYYRLKKLAVAVHNGLRHPSLTPNVLDFRRTVLDALNSQAGENINRHEPAHLLR